MGPNYILHQLQNDGYAFMPEWQSGKSTRAVACAIGKIIDLGKILPGSGVPTIQTLTPRSQLEAPKSHYSGVFGLEEFPLHTDLAHWAMPPRYFMLRCVQGSSEVPTRLLPVSELVDTIGESVLRRALLKPRRSSQFGTTGVLTLLFSSDQTDGFRWDSLFLKPMNAAAREVFEYMTSQIKSLSEISELTLRHPGDTLVVGNWRMLHGRGPANTGPTRIIERVYLSEILV